MSNLIQAFGAHSWRAILVYDALCPHQRRAHPRPVWRLWICPIQKSLNNITKFPKNSRVVIKGPYINDYKGAFFSLDINNIKKHLKLPFNNKIVMIKMKPDRWSEGKFKDGRTGLRYRKDFNITKPYWFMISTDYLQDIKLPIKKYSTKTWEQTDIIDFDSITDSIYKKWDAENWEESSDKNKEEYVKYLLFRYLAGIGDLATRNFVYVNNTVYGIDEDAPKKGDLSSFSILLKKTRSKQVYDWINNNWELVRDFIVKMYVPDKITKPFDEYKFRDPKKIYGEPPNKNIVLKLFE